MTRRRPAMPDKRRMNSLMPTFLLRSPTLLGKNALPSAVIALLCTRQSRTAAGYTHGVPIYVKGREYRDVGRAHRSAVLSRWAWINERKNGGVWK